MATIVKEFIDKTNKELLSERFNCFLSINQISFLENMSRLNGINKSEYLRKLIDDDRKRFS